MKTIVGMSTFFLIVSVIVGEAAEVTPDAINSASLSTITAGPASKSIADPDPAIVRLQVLLDRAGVSPGVIDGLDGTNVTKAVISFENMMGIPPDGAIDPDVVSRLETGGPIISTYTVTDDDLKGLVDHIPVDYGEKAKMPSLGYTSVAEKLAERFHMHIDLLTTLNPGSDFASGDTVQVAMPGPPRHGKVVRIEADKTAGQVTAYDRRDVILAAYPATVGSEDNPSPKGTHKVKGVARMPVFRYNPKVNFKQGKNNKILTIPKGPNGPVGTIWIDLTEPTYGIHGTPDPELIDKVGSHGCIRLTNWDAEELAGMVKPGVVVRFVN
ncbi:Lipoprotein-anchoring transpeptidase ErfK/SrfK [Phyllobacterium sp. CL33Tsu]|uniref:L,D-transpeptidase family protein n=1 Tax=Phyllobacterium sp. CL33Tsu TaxID=1798191 RepID=UPI0008E2C935|nr:L,D-transpeptidase [Phyllobacterium sp. CL33Tsu]SFJ28678.1 Lipoprotein-anchoring transpeptidase ErfK/SrfK [Phyllobacterium sp. CL33Tsu]